MRKRHKIAIGTFSIITFIFIIVITITLNGIIVKQTINNNALKNKIAELEQNTEAKINEIAINLINTKTSFNKNLSTITANIIRTSEELEQINAQTTGDFSKVIEEIIPSVVTIRTLSSQGTGFFIDKNGHIMTNTHVLKGDFETPASIIQIITIENIMYPAKLIGYSDDSDIALLKIELNSTPIKLANSDNIEIGEKVIAIGTPQGFQFTVTDGIISATKRIGPNNLPTYIQTNAELNLGNSGGPLINKDGKVIGINNFKLANSEGIGFALESNTAKDAINKITMNTYNKTILPSA